MKNRLVLSTLCYISKGDKTLMLHRVKRKGDVHAGKWNGLGGKLEDGETPRECVIRECFEESGLEIKRPQRRGIMRFPGFRDQEDWLVFLYICDSFRGKIRASSEGNLEWIPTHNLIHLPLWEGDYMFLQWLNFPSDFFAEFCYESKKLVSHQVTYLESKKLDVLEKVYCEKFQRKA